MVSGYRVYYDLGITITCRKRYNNVKFIDFF